MLYRELFVKIFKYKRFCKFLIAGSTATFVNIFFLYIFHGVLQIQVVVAASLAFLLAYLVSFSLQKFWTFSNLEQNGVTGQMLKYFLVAIFGLGINAIGIYVLVELLFVWYILAQIIISVGLAIINYFLYKLIFKDSLALENKKQKKQVKKILIATGIYPPDSGGPATYSKILKNELPNFAYDIKVVSYGEGSEDGVFKISRQQNVLFRYFKYFLQVWRLAKWADLVYVQGPVSEGLPSYLACRLCGKKYILKVVGDFAWEQGQQRSGVVELLDDFQNKNYSFKVELWRLIEIFVASGASLVITPSEYLKKIVSNWGIKSNGVKVIYNSVRDTETKKSKLDLKFELQLPDKLIMSVSRLVPWKGFDVLIDCVAEMNGDGQDIYLYIVGEGPDKKKLQKRIDNLRIESKVKLLGKLEQAELWKYMRGSNAFVLNTAYEGLSHLLIEAMSLGVPIITTDVGGNGELIEDNKTGILLEYNNQREIKKAIKKILGDSRLADEYVRNAKVKSQKFAKDKMLLALDGLLKSL